MCLFVQNLFFFYLGGFSFYLPSHSTLTVCKKFICVVEHFPHAGNAVLAQIGLAFIIKHKTNMFVFSVYNVLQRLLLFTSILHYFQKE